MTEGATGVAPLVMETLLLIGPMEIWKKFMLRGQRMKRSTRKKTLWFNPNSLAVHLRLFLG
jgi:hypothetical protein